MLRSLRFRLPALFLVGFVLAGLISTVIAVRLFQDYARSQALSELRREARGITDYYADLALIVNERPGSVPPVFAPARLEAATGDEIFYVGPSLFPGLNAGLEFVPESTVNFRPGRMSSFEFIPPGRDRTYLAVAQPVRLGGSGPFVGALIVAKPKTELQSRWVTLIERLAIAFGIGVLVAWALAWYLSRQITGPVSALSEAADEIARGRYGVEIPKVPGGGEIGDLADRFGQMASRLAEADEQERNFLMSVSHDLRTPLTAIRGHVEALREGLAEDPGARAASLDVIASETARLERLVGDVLDLAKLDAHRFTLLREEVDMERLCEQAYSAFGEEARRRGIDYRHAVSSKPVIVSDGDRVLQIISNLLSNAFRWTPDGGRIDLSLGASNGSVSVEVGDTGPGISLEMRERIFRPFFSQDGGGTGLGLAIARELANALGGQIEVESGPGGGSRCKLLVPLTPG
jgi:signal transduction histidine kinase